MTNSKDNKTKAPNVPPLRFPGFSDDWEQTTLNEVADFIKERVNTSCLQDNYVSTENLIGNFGGVQMTMSIPSDTNVIHFKKGDVLVSNIRPYLRKVWFADKEGGCSADVFVFRAKGIEPSFLYNTIANDSFINYVMSGAKGVKMPRGDKQQMLKYPFFVPSIEEQRKISSLLSLLNERIATQNKIIDNLQSLIKGLNDKFHEDIPGESVSFSEIGTAYSGLYGKSGDDFGQGSPFITYLNVYKNNIINETDFGLVAIYADEIQHTVSYGDVLFTLSSETPDEVGIGAVYLGESDKFYLNSFCFGVTIPNKDRIYPPYLAYLVSSTKFRKFVYPLAQGSTRFNLQKSDFMKKKFILPSIEDQCKIFNILDVLDQKLTTEQHLNELYKTQKEHLLLNLFNINSDFNKYSFWDTSC